MEWHSKMRVSTVFAVMLILTVSVVELGSTGMTSPSYHLASSSNMAIPASTSRSGANVSSSPNSYAVGLDAGGVSASYYSSFPVASPYASYASYIGLQENRYNRGLGIIRTSNITEGIKFYAYVKDIGAPAVFDNYSGGSPAGYTLQSNFFVDGNGSGGAGMYRTRLGLGTFFEGSLKNQSYFELYPYFKYWWPQLSYYGYSSFPDYNETIVESGAGHPFLVEGWEFAGFNQSGEFINSTLMVRGYIHVGNGSYLSGVYAYESSWYNTTYFLGTGGVASPCFVLSPVASYGNEGLGIVGLARGQVVWGNYTAYELIEELVNGTFALPQVASVVRQMSEESSVGVYGRMVVNQSTNPFGLPSFTPFAYFSNSTVGVGNGTEDAYFPIVIQGYAFPMNASVSAYAVDLQKYLPVERSGASFLVGTAGDQITPVILNVTASGFVDYSREYFPSAVNISDGVELHAPFIALRPVNGNSIYGFVEIPLSYVFYLLNGYGHSDKGAAGDVAFWDSVANTSKEWFPLVVSMGRAGYNVTWYVPSLVDEYATVLYDFSSSHVTYSSYVYLAEHYLNSPFYIPYYFIAGGNDSLRIQLPLLNQSFTPAVVNSEFNITPSMLVFRIPVELTAVAPWYEKPNAIGEVQWDGQVLWTGEASNVSLMIPYSVGRNSSIFDAVSQLLYSSGNDSSLALGYSGTLTVYSYTGSGVENISFDDTSFNSSIASLLLGGNVTHFPLRVGVDLGGSFSTVVFVGILSVLAFVVVAMVIVLKRQGGDEAR